MRYCLAVATFTVVLLSTQSRFGHAAENPECLTNCSLERRSQDMYCPPAGGYSDEESRRCRERNEAAFKSCVKSCSPAPQAPPPVEPPAENEGSQPVNDQPAASDEQPATTYQMPVDVAPPAEEQPAEHRAGQGIE